MIVVDTNILVYLSIPSPYSKLARELFSRDQDWAVPVLWQSEFRSVLTKYLRRSLISFSEAIQIFSEVEDLVRDNEYQVKTIDVFELVAFGATSSYDCEFVALAKSLDTHLVSMDIKLARAFPETVTLLTDAT